MKNVETTNGFLTRWLICGPKLGDVDVDTSNIPMEDIENRLRARIACEECEAPHRVACGESYSGQTWRYRYTGNNIFVDLSDFYFHLCTVNFYAFTQVEAAKDTEQVMCLWCYPGTDVWVNGEKVIRHEIPVYQPMRRLTAAIRLKQGRNDIFVHCYNLGIRDTRNIFGIQLQGDLAELSNTLPDPDGSVTQMMAADAWLDGVRPKGQSLVAQSAPPAACLAELRYKNGKKTVLWEKGDILDMGAGCEEIDLSVSLHGERLTRNLEIPENDRPVYRSGDVSIEEHRNNVLAELVELGSEYDPEEDPKGLFAYGVYARLAANGGRLSALDKKILMRSLDLVDSCIDCADFTLSVLLRIALTFRIDDEELQNRIRQVVLNFRYWTDEPGKDAMCFTSENHMLLFHGCQMAAGLLYPDDIFTRSGRTGREMNRLGSERCKKWLEQVSENGFEEFLSEVYMCITASAILMLADFGDESVSRMAKQVLVQLLEQLAHHAFRGNAIGPMGRAYRDVIAPHRQGMQSLLHYMSPKAPKRRTYFLSTFTTSGFEIPDYLPRMMEEPVSMVYRSGSAEINLEKTEDYLLSSVSCPGRQPAAPEQRKYGYHATAFAPGVLGYQQHLWYAGLDIDCVAFINHPGVSKDKCEMRPGYWYGNGIMPALRQEGRVLGGIYDLSVHSHPIYFTHLFWPSYALEKSVLEPNWFFGCKGNGYIAIWSSIEGVPFDDVLTGCEYRFAGAHSAFLCVMGSAREDGSFEAFMQKAKDMAPRLSDDGMTLRTQDGFRLDYMQIR